MTGRLEMNGRIGILVIVVELLENLELYWNDWKVYWNIYCKLTSTQKRVSY